MNLSIYFSSYHHVIIVYFPYSISQSAEPNKKNWKKSQKSAIQSSTFWFEKFEHCDNLFASKASEFWNNVEVTIILFDCSFHSQHDCRCLRSYKLRRKQIWLFWPFFHISSPFGLGYIWICYARLIWFCLGFYIVLCFLATLLHLTCKRARYLTQRWQISSVTWLDPTFTFWRVEIGINARKDMILDHI